MNQTSKRGNEDHETEDAPMTGISMRRGVEALLATKYNSEQAKALLRKWADTDDDLMRELRILQVRWQRPSEEPLSLETVVSEVVDDLGEEDEE